MDSIIGMDFSVRDHFLRGCFFFDNAARAKDENNWQTFGWLIGASIYSFQAIYEILLSHTKDENNYIGRWHSLINSYKINVRHSSIVTSYRVQDFHRGAISLYPGVESFYGPVKLKTSKQKGSAASVYVDNGENIENKERNAAVKFDRPINISDSKISTESGLMCPLEMLKEHLTDLHPLLKIAAPSLDWGELNV